MSAGRRLLLISVLVEDRQLPGSSGLWREVHLIKAWSCAVVGIAVTLSPPAQTGGIDSQNKTQQVWKHHLSSLCSSHEDDQSKQRCAEPPQAIPWGLQALPIQEANLSVYRRVKKESTFGLHQTLNTELKTYISIHNILEEWRSTRRWTLAYSHGRGLGGFLWKNAAMACHVGCTLEVCSKTQTSNNKL